MRSLWSSFAAGMGESTFGPGSATSQGASTASTGEPRPGSMRFPLSNGMIPGGFANGFLGIEPRRIGLCHIGSANTGFYGHSGMLDMNGGIGNAPFTCKWILQTLSATTLIGSVHGNPLAPRVITFASAYSGVPFVFIQTSSVSMMVGVDTTITPTTIQSRWSYCGKASFLGQSDLSQTAINYVVVSLGTASQ